MIKIGTISGITIFRNNELNEYDFFIGRKSDVTGKSSEQNKNALLTGIERYKEINDSTKIYTSESQLGFSISNPISILDVAYICGCSDDLEHYRKVLGCLPSLI